MTQKSSLEVTDAQAAAVQKTEHRVTLASINDKIESVEYHNPILSPHTTVAYVKMSNGYLVLGTSTPADPKNFDAELGKKFSLEDAIRKIWPLEGYALCEKLAA
jgi:hypothetical protein